MFSPDTVFVLNPIASHTDYTPLFSGLAASVLVAGMAWYSTRTQRKIAEGTLNVQRDIAKQSVDGQLENARRGRVVESRKEWVHELRNTVALFEATAMALEACRTNPVRMNTAALGQEKAAHHSEMVRLMTVIYLMLDANKPLHEEAINALNGVAGWAIVDDVLPDQTPNEPVTYTKAREYADMGTAFRALDNAVREIIEAAWQKIRLGE